MNQISLRWSRYPDTTIYAISADGLTHAQLRYYAAKVGFLDFQTSDFEPVLVGTFEQRDDLHAVLGSFGYEIAEEKIDVAEAQS